jgi:hypothetical protein
MLYPLRIPLDKLGAAVSPRDKSRKDGALPAVTPEKVSVPFVEIYDIFIRLNCYVKRSSAKVSSRGFWIAVVSGRRKAGRSARKLGIP